MYGTTNDSKANDTITEEENEIISFVNENYTESEKTCKYDDCISYVH